MYKKTLPAWSKFTTLPSACCYRGTDAQATVSVKIEENGKTTVGQAADTDTLVASANAYINSLNKMIIKRDKTAPGTNIENQNFENQKMKGI